MKRIGLVVLACCVAPVIGCGGSDLVPDGGGRDGGGVPGQDGGNGNDSGSGNDTGTMDDSGMMNTDSGSDSGGGFNPGSVSCVVLWLDAGKGVTQNMNAVSKWADQSGKGNDATQNINNRMPSLVMNGINNLPTLHFAQGMGQQGNGNMLVINDSMTMQWGTGDFALWIVGRYNNLPNNNFSTASGLFFGKTMQGMFGGVGLQLVGNYFQGGQGVQAGLGATVDNTQANTITQAGMYNDNMPRAFGYRRAGATLELRLNGMAIATKQEQGMPDVSAPNQIARIGADGDATFRRLNGDISEVIGCKGSISMQDLAAIDGYLKTKYNL